MNSSEALSKSIDYLRENWYRKNTGIVAATLVDDDRVVTETSIFLPEIGQWQHAESATLHKYWSSFRQLPRPGSSISVTLSPCLLDLPNRYGESCTHQLLLSGISRVSFGWLDTGQTPDIEEFSEIGISPELVSDPALQRISHNLFELFAELYGEGGQFAYLLGTTNPWEQIKLLVGTTPFEE